MQFAFENGDTIITGERIDPAIVFDCGQCFRFFPDGDDEFSGVAHGRLLRVLDKKDAIVLKDVDEAEFNSRWRDFFDLDTDYSAITSAFEEDEIVSAAVRSCPGMRLLNQEPFETLITFIISANNNIPRIRKIVEAICRLCGDRINCEGERYAFPSPEQLAALSEEDLKKCGAGYRAAYIAETSKVIADRKVDLNAVEKLEYTAAKKELCRLKGVGPKVADCILLFSMHKKNAFPMDVWIKRTLNVLFGFTPKNDKEAMEFARDRFGEWGGIIQQYLFWYAREVKLGN